MVNPALDSADISRSRTESHSSGRVAPRRFSRLRIGTFRAIEGLCALCGGRAWYRRRYLIAGRLAVRTETVTVGSADLDGYRIAALSDFHAGSFLGRGDLAHVRERVAAFEPDLIVLLGDYVVHGVHEFEPIAEDLGALTARDGVLAVFGNHDYRGRREGELVERLAPYGVRFLRNAGVRIARGAAHLAVVGIEDPEEGKVVDVAAARAVVRPGDVEIALTHNPRAATAFAAPGAIGRGARLVLAGHTHGTQIDAPFLRRLGPAHPGARFDLGATTVLVSRGIGVVGAPLRVGAPAEVLCVTLRASG